MQKLKNTSVSILRFNTINGRCCCNLHYSVLEAHVTMVSFNTVNGRCCCNTITFPQLQYQLPECFNTVNGKDCCNKESEFWGKVVIVRFNTVNGKDCCNKSILNYLLDCVQFQYRKR